MWLVMRIPRIRLCLSLFSDIPHLPAVVECARSAAPRMPSFHSTGLALLPNSLWLKCKGWDAWRDGIQLLLDVHSHGIYLALTALFGRHLCR